MSNVELPGAPLWISAAARVVRWLPAGRYRATNWFARRRVPVFWGAFPADLGGLEFRCDLRDPLMREVCITGRYEPQETTLLQRLLTPGMTFVDVGANWGYFTLLAAHLVGRNGRVVSVEADPSAARTLEANVVRNRLACVTPIAMAASDEARTVTMRRYEAAGDDSSNFGVAFVAALDAGSGAPALEVPAGTLDAALDRCGVSRVDLLKMDIEGAESRAVAGLGRRLRERLVDRLIIELHPAHLRNQGLSPDDLVDSIRSFGYDAWAIDHSRATHRKAAATSVTAESLLTPLSGRAVLGEWPHLLFARRGLGAFGASEAKAGTRQ